MDMNMGDSSMSLGSGSSSLSDVGMNMTNSTVAMDFLMELLDDSDFQPMNIAVAQAFWLRAAGEKRVKPASPRNSFHKGVATATAIARELSYPQFTPIKSSQYLRVPPVGTSLLVLTYLGFVIGLEYHQNFVPGAQRYEAFGLRAAWLTVAQLPLLILLAGKNNLIGHLIGVSYERLNVFHRWVGRMVWLTATLHWAYQQYGWSVYGLSFMEKATDICYPTGVAAWTILTWINVSSVLPLRHWHYEFFVLQHIVTFIGFIVAVMIHVPATYARVYVWIPIGFYLLDRLVRILRYAYNNSRLARAILTPLPGGVSKIRVQSSRVKNWRAGQHVLLSLPRFGAIQSHPATILSTPTSHSNDLVFILKSHQGFTARVNNSAMSSMTALLPSTEKSSESCDSFTDSEPGSNPKIKYTALIDGPYGSSNSDFAGFDTALLIAASTGITYTLPLLLDIAERAQSTPLPLRHLSFVWIIKSSTWTKWIESELCDATANMKAAGLTLDINIFVTCDDKLSSSDPSSNQASTTPPPTEKSPSCKCASSDSSPCCCTRSIQPAPPKTFLSPPSEKPSSPTQSSPCYSSAKPPSLLPPYTLHSGRPALEDMIWDLLDTAHGETGIAVCGPLGLSARCRRAVAGISDERAVHKGSGAEGVYLHVEGFSW